MAVAAQLARRDSRLALGRGKCQDRENRSLSARPFSASDGGYPASKEPGPSACSMGGAPSTGCVRALRTWSVMLGAESLGLGATPARLDAYVEARMKAGASRDGEP